MKIEVGRQYTDERNKAEVLKVKDNYVTFIMLEGIAEGKDFTISRDMFTHEFSPVESNVEYIIRQNYYV